MMVPMTPADPRRTSRPRTQGPGARAPVTPRRVDAPADRTDPLEILALQATTRVPDLVPIRYGRMAASPFAFFRGAAAVMAADLAHEVHSHLDVQLCGDAHLVNFGGFASPGAGHDLRRQRLRRDASRARSSGTSSVWPPASRWPAGAAAFDDAAARVSWWRCRPRLPRGHPGVRRPCATSSSGTCGSTPTTLVAPVGHRGRPAR